MPTTTPRPSYRAGMEARDLDAVMEACAPDVVLHSPISDHARFEGREQVREVLEAVLEAEEHFGYVDELAAGDTQVFRVEGTVGGHPVEEIVFVRLDDQGLVREFRVFARPLSGLTALLAGLAPRLGRRRGRVRAVLLSVFVRPLAWITRVTDGVGARLALGRR